ncbi:tyrosine-type recombinase/integrase [uncultured Ilyobacter sp.]|uniref:tyrosine-type recombinase/integrase n=1 Tax=uncultured Ilyobacter sp. TaxID=544433 RepID=UPI0029C0DADB|nr:tyrosine-type recombinase/integrase [uncultured Ilyobacter sp.]
MRNRGIKLPSNFGTSPAVKSDQFSSDMTIKDFLDTFHSFMSVKELQGLANSTLEDYRHFMRYFENYVKELHSTDQILRVVDIDLFRSYLYYMVNERKLKNTTVNLRLRSMKVYLNWLHEEGRMEQNISKRLKLLKVSDNKVRILSDKEVRKMLKTSDKTTYRGFRTFVIMVLMLDCGPRVSETVSIKVEDVDLKEGIVTIRGSEAKSKKWIGYNKLDSFLKVI